LQFFELQMVVIPLMGFVVKRVMLVDEKLLSERIMSSNKTNGHGCRSQNWEEERSCKWS
jgi:hypothetical protein